MFSYWWFSNAFTLLEEGLLTSLVSSQKYCNGDAFFKVKSWDVMACKPRSYGIWRPSFFWNNLCNSFQWLWYSFDREQILMNLGRLDHFRNHCIEIIHDSEQVDKRAHHAQSLWKKMLPHFAKWSFFLLSLRRTGLHYTYQDWMWAKDWRSALHNRKKNKKQKRGKMALLCSNVVKCNNATVWSTYRTYAVIM